MIDINLIPTALRKNSSESAALSINIPHEIILGVGSGLVLLIVTVHLFLSIIWLSEFGYLSFCNIGWQKLSPDKIVLDKIYDESKDMKTKIKTITDLTKKSVLWSPKFNAISDALSRGLWLKRMVLDRGGLSMDGSVVSKNQNEIANVGLFIASLKQNDAFMDDFSSLEVNSIQRGRDNSTEVTDFTIIARLNDSKLDDIKPVGTKK